MSIFEYQILSHRDSIRLIYLLPGAKGDPLCCRVRHVRISENPSYEALSYTWGAPALTETIWEKDSGSSIAITRNLKDALEDLRKRDRPRVLWVDAACIKQSDADERGHQVSLMGEVFQNATKVVVWLGRSTKGNLSSSAELCALSGVAARLDSGMIAKMFNIGSARNPADSSEVYRVLVFLDRPWFRRVWTVQEFVLAKDVEMQIGRQTLSLKHFRTTVMWLAKVFQELGPASATRKFLIQFRSHS